MFVKALAVRVASNRLGGNVKRKLRQLIGWLLVFSPFFLIILIVFWTNGLPWQHDLIMFVVGVVVTSIVCLICNVGVKLIYS